MIAFIYTWFQVKKITDFIQSEKFDIQSDDVLLLIENKSKLYRIMNKCQSIDKILTFLWEIFLIVVTLLIQDYTFLMFVIITVLQCMPYAVLHISENDCVNMSMEINNMFIKKFGKPINIAVFDYMRK